MVSFPVWNLCYNNKSLKSYVLQQLISPCYYLTSVVIANETADDYFPEIEGKSGITAFRWQFPICNFVNQMLRFNILGLSYFAHILQVYLLAQGNHTIAGAPFINMN